MSVARPCPFCGDPAEKESTGPGNHLLYRCYLHTAGMLLDEWNRRATDALLVQAEEALSNVWKSDKASAVLYAIRKHREEVGG